MALSASGPLSLPLENLRALLAASSNFQSWVGAANAEEAKASIHLVAVEGTPSRPFALIAQGDSWEREASADGAKKHFEASGELFLLFEADISEPYQGDPRDAELEFTNAVGAIVSDMESLAGSDGYLAVRRIGLKEGPARSQGDEKSGSGDYYQIIFSVEWGI